MSALHSNSFNPLPYHISSPPREASQQSHLSKSLNDCTQAIYALTEALASRKVEDNLIYKMEMFFDSWNQQCWSRNHSKNISPHRKDKIAQKHQVEEESQEVVETKQELNRMNSNRKVLGREEMEGKKKSIIKIKSNFATNDHNGFSKIGDNKDEIKGDKELAIQKPLVSKNLRIKPVSKTEKQRQKEKIKEKEEKEEKKEKQEQKQTHYIQRNSMKKESDKQIYQNNKIQDIKMSRISADYKDIPVSIDIPSLLNLDEIICSSKLAFSSKNSCSPSNPSSSLQDLISSRFATQFKKTVTTLLSEISRSSYYGFLNKHMDKTVTKVYFSRNCIYNVIRIKEELSKREEFGEAYIEQLIRTFNKESTQSLKFLKLHYPQQEKILFDSEISNMIPTIHLQSSHKYQLITELQDGDEFHSLTWTKIKHFLNQLITQTNSKYSSFETNLKSLFKDKTHNDFSLSPASSFKYLIGSKLKLNTPKYTSSQLLHPSLSIKSGELLRIIIKWIQNLESQIADEIQKFKHQIQLLQKYISVPKEQSLLIDAINEMVSTDKGSKSLNKSMGGIFKTLMERYEGVWSVEEREEKINLFTGVMAVGVENVVGKYLYELLENLNLIRKFKPVPTAFQIFDLFRGKCSGSHLQIKQVYENIQASPLFEIIQIKNRVNTPNRDYLVNMKMKGTAFVCEIQLHINTGSKQDDLKLHKSHCENDFNHFLYELERSKFGPLAEMVSVYSLNSDLPGFFTVEKLNGKRSAVKRKVDDLDLEMKESQGYELIVTGKKGEKYEKVVDKDAEVLIMCDYCSKISYNDPIQYWRSANQNICEVCLIETMRNQQRSKYFFKQHHKDFNLIEYSPPESCLQDYSLKHFVKINKQTLRIQKYIKVKNPPDKQRLFRRMGYDKMITESQIQKEMKKCYVYEVFIKVKQTRLTRESSILSSMSQSDLELLNLPMLLSPLQIVTIFYLQCSPLSTAYLLSMRSQLLVANKNKALGNIISVLEQPQRECQLKGVQDYMIFEGVPRRVNNDLVSLSIVEEMENMPRLDIESLKVLRISVRCRLGELEVGNLRMGRIEELDIRLQNKEEEEEGEEEIQKRKQKRNQENKQEIFDIKVFKSNYLTKLILKFFSYNNFRINYEGPPLQTNNPSQIPPNQSLPSLQTLNIQIQDYSEPQQQSTFFTQISLCELSSPFLHTLILTSSTHTLINLTSTNLPSLQTLEIATPLYHNKQKPHLSLLGFHQPISYPQLSSATFRSLTNSNFQYFPISNLKTFVFGVKNEQSLKRMNVKGMRGEMERMERMEVGDEGYFCERVKGLEKLRELEIVSGGENVNLFEFNKYRCSEILEGNETFKVFQCCVLKQLSQFPMPALKTLTILNTSSSPNNLFRIQLDQQLPSLKSLKIHSYDHIKTTCKLLSLQALSLSAPTIDITSLTPLNLKSISFEQCDSLKQIKLSPEQVTNVERVEVFSWSDVKCFEGVKLVKNYFWNLKSVREKESDRETSVKMVKGWDGMNVREVEKGWEEAFEPGGMGEYEEGYGYE